MKPEKQSNHTIFLQATNDRVIWLEVKREEETSVILGGGEEFFLTPKQGESSEEEQEKRPLSDVVKAVASQLHLSWFAKPNVVLVAPTHRLTARFMETPPSEEEEMRELVAFEVSEALQLPIEEIAWDMLISSTHGEEMEKHLLWTASRKNFLNSFLREWTESELTPTQATPDFWAYYEFLLGVNDEMLKEPSIIISQDDDRATICVANRRSIYVARSISLNRPGLSNAEQSEEEQKDRLLSLEIERTMTFASDRFPKGTIVNMILCGFHDWPLSHVQQTADRNHMHIDRMSHKDPLSYFKTEEESISEHHLPLLCLAFCRMEKNITGINLLEEREAKISWQAALHEAAAPSKKFLQTSGALLAAILLVWIGGGLYYSSAKEKLIQKGDDLYHLALRLQKEETALREMVRQDKNQGDLFMHLAEKLPQGVFVKSISIDTKTGVEIGLRNVNHQRIIEIIESLNKGGVLKQMALDRTVNETGGMIIYLKGKM